MSAEQLRSTRIVLLKATHWPFVGVILAWEKARQSWTHGRDAKASLSLSRRAPNATRAVRRPLSGRPLQQPLLATAILEPPLGEQAHAESSSIDVPSKHALAAPETVEALKTAVHDLQDQVQALATLLAYKQAKDDSLH